MPYYDKSVIDNYSQFVNYFKSAITSEDKNIGHGLLFWGGDISSECAIALEIARLLNCKKGGDIDCDCINCRWIREQAHPAVKIYTRLDFKEASSSDEDSSSGKKNITVEQAKAIVNELSVTSDYHRVYIFCDRDEDGNLLPLNQLNFPDKTSNALLKTFEEPPKNTTFIILTKDKSDVISTVVSRCQSFFVPSLNRENMDYSAVESFISDYWAIERNQVLEFEKNLFNLVSGANAMNIFTQMQNYMLYVMKNNFDNKALFYKLIRDIKYVEDAKRQVSLSPAMNIQTVCQNLSFNLILN